LITFSYYSFAGAAKSCLQLGSTDGFTYGQEARGKKATMRLDNLANHARFAVSALLVLLFFHPVLFSDNTFFFRDIHRWFYPAKHFLAQFLQNGFIPYWCPNYFCGAPFLGDLQSGVFYPPCLIFALLPFPWSFNLYVCLHFFLGFLFFYGFVKSIGLSSRTALFIPVSFCYGSFVIASVNTLNNLSAAIWLPAALWAFHEARMKKKRSAHGWTVLSLTLCLLAGEPQLFLLTVALLALFAFFLPRHEQRLDLSFGIRSLGMIVLFVLAALLVAAAQLGPAFADYTLSIRTEGFTFQEAARFSLRPSMLKHLLLPLVFPPHFETDPNFFTRFFPSSSGTPWLLTLYPGTIIVPLAALSLLSRFRKRVLLWLLVFIVSTALALGENAPLFRIFYNVFPAFRFPEKFIFPAAFSLLLMAAHGFEDLLSRIEKRERSANLLFLGLFVFLVLDVFWAHRNLNPARESAFYQAYDPRLQTILNDPSHFRVYVDPDGITPGSVNATILEHHRQWQMLLMPNLGILHHLHHVDGVTGLELRYQYLITQMLDRPWSQRIRFLKLANVKYIVSHQNLEQHKDLVDELERISPLVLKVKKPLPRAWVVGQVLPMKRGSVEELLEPSFDPSFQVIAGGSIPNLSQADFFKEVDSLRYEKDGRIRIRVTSVRPSVLVLSESSYPGWRVFVNGQERACLWLNLLFQGVELPSGQSEIVFQFRPERFSAFVFVSLASLCIVWIVFFASLFFRKKIRH